MHGLAKKKKIFEQVHGTLQNSKRKRDTWSTKKGTQFLIYSFVVWLNS